MGAVVEAALSLTSTCADDGVVWEMADYLDAAAILGLCFLLTHFAAPATTLIGAIIAARTRRAELCPRGALKIALWIAAPWLATLLTLAAVGPDPIDAILNFDGLIGPVPTVSLLGAAAVAIGVARSMSTWRRYRMRSRLVTVRM